MRQPIKLLNYGIVGNHLFQITHNKNRHLDGRKTMTESILPRVAFMALLAASGCVNTTQTMPASIKDTQKINLNNEQSTSVRTAILARLKDPNSAQFGPLHAARDNEQGLIFVCGTVNAKNSFGGYTGPKIFSGSLSNIPGLTPQFFPLTVGGDDTKQAVARDMCRQNGAF